MNKQLANQVLTTLEETANSIEQLQKKGKIHPKTASELVHDIDAFSDKFHIAVFGEKAHAAYRAKMAKIIKQEPDEPYMKSFENIQAPIQVEKDEPYMHKTEKSFNCDSIPTYDSDRSSTVSEERKEYDVRDLSEHADKTKPQPSWPGKSSGKSTRQGSTKEKTWAP